MITILDVGLAKKFATEDPVRPDISGQFRSTGHREMFALYNDDIPALDALGKAHSTLDLAFLDARAVLCAAYCKNIPINEKELLDTQEGSNVIFYTVWSRGGHASGRKIIFDVWALLKEREKYTRYITMSPKTDMAKRFHLNNGAVLIAENEETYNFEYK